MGYFIAIASFHPERYQIQVLQSVNKRLYGVDLKAGGWCFIPSMIGGIILSVSEVLANLSTSA